MKLVIDASNIRAGGGLVHLEELLRAADPRRYGFGEVEVWGGAATLARLPEQPWLKKRSDPLLDGNLAARVYWQMFRLPERCQGADLLFVPGGTHPGNVRPLVTMIQNWLPFDAVEMKRYGLSREWLRLRLLRYLQIATLRKADAVIYLSHFAEGMLNRQVPGLKLRSAVVQHGVAEAFARNRAASETSPSAAKRVLSACCTSLPSSIAKEQLNLLEAVARLYARGLPVRLDLAGAGKMPCKRDVEALIEKLDPAGKFLGYCGQIPYADVRKLYANADLFVFPSSCETFGMPVVEAMANGVPVISSDRTVMPEIVGDAGGLFRPDSVEDIAKCIERHARDAGLRATLAQRGYERALQFSWKRTAERTFELFLEVSNGGSSQVGVSASVK